MNVGDLVKIKPEFCHNWKSVLGVSPKRLYLVMETWHNPANYLCCFIQSLDTDVKKHRIHAIELEVISESR